MKFFIADAFTDQLFGGNPAGVVLIPEGEDFLPEETMRNRALRSCRLLRTSKAFPNHGCPGP